MTRARRAARWLLRRGGLILVGLLCVQFVVSRKYAMMIAPTRHEHVGFAAGMCSVVWREVLHPDPFFEMDRPGVRWNDLGGSAWMSSFSRGLSQQHHFVWFPMWVLIIPCAVWAVMGVRLVGRWPAGHCGRCGYDQRGLAGDAVCPECGGGRA